MRIYSDTLGPHDLRDAMRAAGDTAYLAEFPVPHSARKRRQRWEFDLATTDGKGAAARGGKCASWDQWGNALALLFSRDPEAIAGPYKGREHFRYATAGRYPCMPARAQTRQETQARKRATSARLQGT